MSSRRPQQMVTAVLERVTPSKPTTFRCEYCGLRHESERPNCPACGGPLTAE